MAPAALAFGAIVRKCGLYLRPAFRCPSLRLSEGHSDGERAPSEPVCSSTPQEPSKGQGGSSGPQLQSPAACPPVCLFGVHTTPSQAGRGFSAALRHPLLLPQACSVVLSPSVLFFFPLRQKHDWLIIKKYYRHILSGG